MKNTWVGEETFGICILAMCANLKTKGHDFTGQAVPSEECLHGVGKLDLLRKHVPQQLVKEVTRVKQCDQNPSQLVLPGKSNTRDHAERSVTSNTKPKRERKKNKKKNTNQHLINLIK